MVAVGMIDKHGTVSDYGYWYCFKMMLTLCCKTEEGKSSVQYAMLKACDACADMGQL